MLKGIVKELYVREVDAGEEEWVVAKMEAYGMKDVLEELGR